MPYALNTSLNQVPSSIQHVEEDETVSMRDLMRSSMFSAATMLLDENHCVVDASMSMLSLLQVQKPSSMGRPAL